MRVGWSAKHLPPGIRVTLAYLGRLKWRGVATSTAITLGRKRSLAEAAATGFTIRSRTEVSRTIRSLSGKTDPRGIITYANQVFCAGVGLFRTRAGGISPTHYPAPRYATLRLFRCCGKPCKRGVKYSPMWSTCAKKEITTGCGPCEPSWNERGEIIAFHSSRRTASQRAVVSTLSQLYQQLVRAER